MLCSLGAALQVPYTTYACENRRCVPQPRTLTHQASHTSLRLCEMTCGAGNLWPQPTSSAIAATTMAVSVDDVQHSVSFGAGDAVPSHLVRGMQQIFDNALALKATECAFVAVDSVGLVVDAAIASASETLSLETDESYTLRIGNGTAVITAATIYGYRHALVTLTQLIEYDELSHAMHMASSASIIDGPAYRHRGVVLDTSRQYYSVAAIRRLLDGMGATKLNTFHWHFTDTASFPVEIKGEPRLTSYGALHPRQIYTQPAIRELVAYAKARGVRVIPEVDAPSHAGAGWQWGVDAGLGELGVCFGHNPWYDACVEPPCGQLNPFNDHVYDILKTVYSELHGLFDADVFHMGGDEVHLGCWNMTKAVTDHMSSDRSPDAFYHIWGAFQKRARSLVDAHKKIAIWTSDLTNAPYLRSYFEPGNTIVQMWTRSNAGDAAKLTAQGYEVVASYYDAYYLDCGFGNWLRKGDDWCHPYHHWSVLYDLDLVQHVPVSQRRLVLGGEVALWSEEVDEATMDAKIWPRAAAAAERWWTNPRNATTWKDAIDRLRIQRDRLVEMGLQADAIQPHWCRLHPGECTLLP
ncbi:hypothetical protein SPRG_12747 [Saprolegnia parasitica CBS 223.65]|uniref:Beta-hexosaminidase n=1 Tax=Saprolegnia parasitica (strain CBS 223.65) TaxID=695850 RepID=A0A067C7D1_SAPPC|nr:hypothetical protein SPRG_12747 [Saprolegnia parasitica CBS 223.65]KDO22466.1 hypothetical protein SPRG_12747 [Saprolegnia parasitica CBS 223.65]|eukprot:XP_012206853.1 hypothetical protein SPRG_12747 [Saprolegnia parasitica CBS 223.65]